MIISAGLHVRKRHTKFVSQPADYDDAIRTPICQRKKQNRQKYLQMARLPRTPTLEYMRF